MKRKVGRPPVDTNKAKKIRFQFVFSNEQVETMGGREGVLKFVRETITKEIWTRKTQ